VAHRCAQAGLVFALAAGACSDQGPDTKVDVLEVSLSSPAGTEGAARLTLQGTGFGEVSGVGGTTVYVSDAVGALDIVLVHPSGGDLRFEVAYPDGSPLPGWVLHEVAGPDDSLRTSLAAYTLELER